MKQLPTIKKIMTPFPYTIEIDASLQEAQNLMEEHRIHHLPVTEGGQLIGILSERDISLTLSLTTGFSEKYEFDVRSACTPAPYSVDMDADLGEVLDQMINRHIGSTVITRKGKSAGIITYTDICKALRDLLFAEKAPEPDQPSAA
ncbi:MAG: CBS domain-containing protein [Bdellovibrionales bacterium]|nr:CBS domain-containing protein [Bdellovibrionales bacterium]